MKKLIALVMALVMALSLTTIAWGATHTATDLATLEAKVAAAADGDIIDLDCAFNGIVVDSDVTIAPTGKKVTIDATGIPEPFKVTGKLTLGENVTIKSDDGIIGVYGTGELVVNGATIYHTGGNDYVAIDVAGGTVTVNEKSTIYKVNGIPVSVSGTLNVAGGTIYSDGDDHVAVVVNATGVVNMTDGHVYATDSSAILAKDGGEVTISGGKVEAMKEDPAFCAAFARNGGKITVTGTAVVDAAAGYGLVAVTGGEVTVAGGTVDGVKAHEAASAKATISGGTVTGDVSAANGATMTITGGTFENEPDAAYLNGLTTMVDTNGNYYVTAPVTMGDKFDLYLADAGMNAALKLKTPDVAGLSFTDVAAKTNKDGSGNVAYIAANNGQYFVKTSAPTVADYAVTDAGKNTVLYYVTVAGTSAANFEYVESVTAFNKFSTYDKCGYVTGTPVAGETYFVASDDLVYMAAAAGTGPNYLLNGKVVSGIHAGAAETHTFVLNGYKYDATLKTNVPTSAICTKCMMTTGSIYLTTKVPATYTLYPTTGEGSNAYVVALPSASAVVVPSAPSTDKVESAETFDAGIAMYVGMSVMAATGAVVLKKRED